MTLFPVFSRWLVRELENRGFRVVKMEKNRIKANLIVYFFEETPELRKAVQELTHK